MANRTGRRRRELERHRGKRRQRARETQAAQVRAAAVKARQRQKRHRIEAAALFALAAIIAITHFFEHAGTLQIASQGLEDLLLGYPMAAVLAIFGAIRLGT